MIEPAQQREQPTHCDNEVAIYENGGPAGFVCPEEIEASGLTVIELSDGFAPHIFKEAPELGTIGEQPYLDTYLALADERFSELPREVERERYLELFGISPTFRVLRARLAEAERHQCHAEVDDAALAEMEGTLRAWTIPMDEQRARIRRVAYARHVLEAERERLGLPDLDALAGSTERPGTLAQLQRESRAIAAIRAAQEHLACDGLLPRFEAGIFDQRTGHALAQYQRRHMVVGTGALDASTREQLLGDSVEADFMAVLRTLRERVVDASGVIEDGSARGEWGTVLGRVIDPPEMRTLVGHEPAEHGAPDWVSPAVEAAARALGWTDAQGFLEHMAQDDRPSRVAVRLPARPAYHAAHMELRAEIDRGDVWYEYPFTATGAMRSLPVRRRPVLTLYARDGEREIALVRWPTTIGGWKPERLESGAVALRYKESPPGPRIWRDLIASPAWLPPPSTPNDELVRRVPGAGWRANTALFGPSYRSAYGLVMVMNHRVMPPRSGEEEPWLFDEGVRAHGSVSYASILRGTSHGCHRLYNHLAVRMGGFLLAHRDHVRHGSDEVRYMRRATAPNGSVHAIRIQSRGYRYELTPPVQVNVLEGRIMGSVREPQRGFRPLRGALIQRAEQAAAVDEGL